MRGGGAETQYVEYPQIGDREMSLPTRCVLIALLTGFSFVAFSNAADAADVASNHEVAVPQEMKLCITDSDCQLVATTCDQCCPFGVINKNFASSYKKLIHEQCENEPSHPCVFMCSPHTPICKDKTCTVN